MESHKTAIPFFVVNTSKVAHIGICPLCHKMLYLQRYMINNYWL